MRALLLALLALVPSALAQTPPDSTVHERVRAVDTPTPAQPVAVRMLAGTLGGAAGTYGGFQIGESMDPDGFLVSDGAFYGSLIGSALGSALLVSATGRRDGFWRTLAGATVGTLGGLAFSSLVHTAGGSSMTIEQALVIGLPIGSTVGAALANAAGD